MIKDEKIEEIIKDKISDPSDDIIDESLLEEIPGEETVPEEEEITLKDINSEKQEEFDVNKYLADNYSFAELDSMSLEEFIAKELEKPQVQQLKILIDSKANIKGFPTFEDIMKDKKEHGGIFVIVVGLDFEQEIFGIPVETYVCRTIKDKDHMQMLEENPLAENDFEAMKKFFISKAVLFPPLREEDVPRMKAGVIDILLPAIMKQSRYNPNHKIIRI